MRLLKTVCLLLLAGISFGQDVNIIPRPEKITMGKGSFEINAKTTIYIHKPSEKADISHSAQFEANYLKGYIKKHYSFDLPISYIDYNKQDTINAIFLAKRGSPDIGSERRTLPYRYLLIVGKNNIICMGDANSVLYGVMSLIQLLPIPSDKQPIPLLIPQLRINDIPRFQYRGMHLDCSRHFWSVDFVKKYIDYLALHKFNKFHWHLTDDQGWRIEIKKYPKLTSVGGWRNGTIIGRYPGTGNDGLKYGGYYTQEQIKEVVKYAAERYIDVIPEIEMPGHSSAAIAAYPELSCFPNERTIIPVHPSLASQLQQRLPLTPNDTLGRKTKLVQETWGVFDDVFCAGQEKTFEFLKDVMDEVLSLFPSKYIHVGGDECPKENWKRCPHCQKRIKDNNLKDEHELQSYFIQRMEIYLNSKGRILIGWDEILEGGLAPNAVVMSWRGEAGGIEAAKQKHYVIMTPGNPVYFDHTQSENEDSVTIGGYNPIEKVYAYEPIPKELNEEEGKYVLGAQANLWTEYIKNTKKVEYMIFPRMAALSEVLWSRKENRDWKDFEKRLMMQFKRYDLWKTNYSKAYFDLKTKVVPKEDYRGIIWEIRSKYSRQICEYCTIVSREEFIYKKDTILVDTFPQYDVSDPTKLVGYKFEKINKKAGDKGFIQSPHYGNGDTLKIISITESKKVSAWQALHHSKGPVITQDFRFSKATGKKITLEKQASKSYPGDGAFTLVNGVQNEKGLARSKEFLGFSGEDCIATIDLGKEENISFVKVHYLHQPGSWIYQPSAVSISVSNDGISFSPVAISNPIIANNEAINEFLQPANARFIKVHISNFGTIPSGNPGAGSKAWLFVDEIEIN